MKKKIVLSIILFVSLSLVVKYLFFRKLPIEGLYVLTFEDEFEPDSIWMYSDKTYKRVVKHNGGSLTFLGTWDLKYNYKTYIRSNKIYFENWVEVLSDTSSKWHWGTNVTFNEEEVKIYVDYYGSIAYEKIK